MRKKFKGTMGDWKLESETPSSLPWIRLRTENRSLNIPIYLGAIKKVQNNYKDGTFDFIDEGGISTSEENIANAKLIESAPKMLKELELLHKTLCEIKPEWYMKYNYDNVEEILNRVLE